MPSKDKPVVPDNLAIALEDVLGRCGNDLRRDNIMRLALSIRKLAPPMLPAGVVYDTSPDNCSMLTQMALQRSNGKTFEPVGQVISGTE